MPAHILLPKREEDLFATVLERIELQALHDGIPTLRLGALIAEKLKSYFDPHEIAESTMSAMCREVAA